MAQQPASSAEPEEELSTPWHFKLLLLAVVLYLVYRFVQMSIWGIQWLF